MATVYTNLIPQEIPNDSVSTSKIQNEAVTTEKIKNLGVTNDKIVGPIPKNKIAPLGYQLSPSCGVYTKAPAAREPNFSTVTNLTVTITTTGRPVALALVPDGSNGTFENATAIVLNRTTNGEGVSAWTFRYTRDGASLGTFLASLFETRVTTISYTSCFFTIDPVAAGTYTYAFQARADASIATDSVSIRYYKLLAFEL